ncbi:Myb/SANT-like domain, harbinger transposase-derived nuclease domain protein [Tanacetum coccineum]
MGDSSDKLNFTAEQLKFFLETCVDEVNRLGPNGGSLHVESWKKVAQTLEDTYGIKTTQKKLKNKFDYVKGKYHLWANLKGKTGNVYNSETNSFNFTEEEWKELNVKTKNKANNLRNSPLLYPDLCTYLYEKCAASGPNRQVFGKRNQTPPSSSHNPVNQVLQIESAPMDEGGSSVPPPTKENHDSDFETSYDNGFESGSPVPPHKSPSQTRPKKKAKGSVSEFEEDMKQAIINLAKGGFSKNKGPSADECVNVELFGVSCHFVSCDAELFGVLFVICDAVGALDGTLIHASIPFTEQHLYRARGRARFPILKKMPSYPFVTQRDIVVACFAIHNFIRKERLSDEFFSLYDHHEVHDSSNLQDDNVVDEDVQPYGSVVDQEYMTNLRDFIAAQCP